MMTVLSTYFQKRRSFAISIAACGTATGGLVFPAMARQLLPQVGFPWTIRAIAFVMLAILLTANIFVRARVPRRKSGSLFEWQAFRELPYLLFTIGMFLSFWGLYFAFYYVTYATLSVPSISDVCKVGSFGRDIVRLSQNDSISLLMILNGVGMPGRLIPGLIADRYLGPLNTLIPFMLMSGVMMFVWIAIRTQSSLIVFAVFYGFFASAIQSLLPATLSSLTVDLRRAGVRMGMVFSALSFASLTGPPIAGALIQQARGNYLHAQVFAATVLAAGALTLVGARVAQTGLHLRRRM